MKFSLAAIAALAGIVAAAPTDLEKRQITANDLAGACKKITLIYARASTEIGNMGSSMGPAVCSGLKTKFGAGSVACQGVGGPYTAGLMDNVSLTGTSNGAIQEAIRLFNQANTKCPETLIVAGGYSQGTAVMMNAISKLPDPIRNKVLGVVLFGYTKNGQQKGGIPNFPKERVKVFCSSSDGVCGGALLVTIGHFSYLLDGSGPAATNFLAQAINGAGAGGASKGKGFGKGGM